MGVETAWRPFTPRPAQHARLLQLEALHAADAGRAPGSVVLTHHEALEEDELTEWQTRTQRVPALLLTSTVQCVHLLCLLMPGCTFHLSVFE